MVNVLMASLGKTPFRPAIYGFGTEAQNFQPTYSEEYFVCAIAQHYQSFDKLILLLTQDAINTHWENNSEPQKLQQRWKELGLQIPVEIVVIENGSNEPQLWQIFEEIEKACDPASNVTLDITNGFRSLPMLFLLAIQYLRQSKKVNLKEILYGAFEAQQNGVSPVFNLTPFITLLDWSNGVHVFENLGNLEFIAQQLESVQNALPNQVEYITSLVTSLRILSVALDYVRPDEIFKEVDKLNRALDKLHTIIPGDLEPSAKPFTDGLRNRIKQEFAGFASVNENNMWEQLSQQRNLIEWYLKQKRIVSAALLAREWVISYYMLGTKPSLTREEMGVRNSREAISGKLSNLKKQKKLTDLEKGIKPIWDDLPNVRNDLAHIGQDMSKRLDNLETIQSIVKNVVEQIKLLPILPTT